MTDFVEIVAKIDELIMTKQTGALFIVSDNRLTQLYLERGEINSLTYKRKLGVDVLAELKQVIQATVGFHEGKKTKSDQNLPDTVIIMADLREGLSVQDLERSYFKVSLPSDLLAKIKDAYIGIIGPVAEILFNRALKDSGDLSFLITSLRDQMDSESDVREFNRCLERLDI